MKTIFDELQQEVKNWWISLILGILYVIVAISLMFSPLSGYAVLSILFSVSMLFSGLLEISFAVSNRRRVDCVRRLLDARRSVPLGPAAMETLTVIAYNQPVSRAFIEQVRGVDSSSSVSGLRPAM